MESTPRANRVHIGIYGKCNSGKSSLINAITGQQTAVVSELPGTTTDPVNKSMEVPGLGAITFIDTAGFDDDSELGERRLEQTRKAADRTDIALVVYGTGDSETEDAWVRMFGQRNVPVVAVLNKIDTIENREEFIERMRRRTGMEPVAVSARTGEGIDKLIHRLGELGRGAADEATITGDLVTEGDVVMLIMPQDAQAPKGRLILPQVQTIRELLDKRCIVVSCTPDTMEGALRALSAAPKLVITDSQAFGVVSRMTPAESLLTSFSVLFAHYKGDSDSFVAGAAATDRRTKQSRVLIAEACTHAPATEDIGRVKIPNLLRKRVGEGLRIDVVGGTDFPEDLTPYDLVIHCGACMFNRRHVLSRLARAEAQGVPMTNYGVTIARLTGILDRVVYPKGRE